MTLRREEARVRAPTPNIVSQWGKGFTITTPSTRERRVRRSRHWFDNKPKFSLGEREREESFRSSPTSPNPRRSPKTTKRWRWTTLAKPEMHIGTQGSSARNNDDGSRWDTSDKGKDAHPWDRIPLWSITTRTLGSKVSPWVTWRGEQSIFSDGMNVASQLRIPTVFLHGSELNTYVHNNQPT